MSLIGLVYIQLYWITNAISVKEVKFNRGVNEAISSAIYKYNKIELAYKLFSHRNKNPQVKPHYAIMDSLNRLYYQQIISGDNREEPPDENNVFLQSRFSLDTEKAIDEKTQYSFDTTTLSPNNLGVISVKGYLQRNSEDELEDASFNLFRERTKMINDFFDDLIYNQFSSNISNEMRKPVLDSIIKSELQAQGIKTKYEFGVYNPVLNSFYAESTDDYTDKLLKEGYFFNLFPNNVFSNPDYLVVYFPNQKRYMFSEMSLMLGISSVFIIAVIFSFVFVIFTVIRQKKLSVMKNDFISNMTHELKTPISTISLACQALNDEDVQKTEELYKSYVTMINEENYRLGTMTEKVLQTALIDKGKLKLSFSGLDVHEIINNAIEKTALQLKSRNGEIEKKFRADCSYLEADKVHLENVIFNLIDNAIKYTVKDPRICISTDNTEKGILISVEDNGVGISKSQQKTIFDDFYRVSSGNIHDVKGFGLGLSYVKKIVELHHGNIELKSELNKGSKLTIFLPFGFNEQRKNESN